MSRCFRLVPLLLLMCPVGDTAAQDWPWWRGVRRDGTVSGFVAPTAWRCGPWEIEVDP